MLPLALVGAVVYSGLGSWASARLLAGYVAGVRYRLEPGPNPEPAAATDGPFDRRLGYTGLPAMIERLQASGFETIAQSRVSDRYHTIAGLGLFPPYPEKTRAGLSLTGRDGAALATAGFPRSIYTSIDAVPEPVRETLLFLENRELLDERFPYRNPAIEWDRFVAAVVNFAGGKVLGGSGRFGASTLATQLEKLRHSPDGVTRTPGDKARQMVSATLRSYLDGPLTSDARRAILTDYLNALPVGAQTGYGEVIGLRDGLHVWFGIDPDSADHALRSATAGSIGPEAARAFRAGMMLLLAQRRPSHYLQTEAGRRALAELTDAHLRLVGAEAVVRPQLAQEAAATEVALRATAPPAGEPISFVERKATNAARTHLAELLGAPGLYQLDRYDLRATTTIDSGAQAAATELLRRLGNPDFVRAEGLNAERLLGSEDPGVVAYSLVLFERTPMGNAVRVQVDNLDRPFDLNLGARLELGSTAKLRTLVTYLELVAELHAARADTTRDTTAADRRADDPITRWARQALAAHPEITLERLLDNALQRRYSANPSETFFTGGGTHVFGNFDDTRDREAPTVLEGFRHSINLVYVRLMRDIVRYYEQRIPGVDPSLREDPAHPGRRAVLERFADHESRELMARYYRRHRGLTPDSSLGLLLGVRASPERAGRLLRALAPGIPTDELAAALERRFPGGVPDAVLRRLERGMPAGLGLADRAYLVNVHPLELFAVAELRKNPELTLPALLDDPTDAVREAYAWLHRSTPTVRRAQDRAIRVTLEREAFQPILAAWRRVGYPYQDIVPSYGSAIGSSGDRPGALAELVGILLSGGIRRPVVRVEQLHFAEGTPFEVILRRDTLPGERVMTTEVAAAARFALADVVAHGTASGLRNAIVGPGGVPLVLGGKTGTGQNLSRTFAPGGRPLAVRTVSRTATFVFFLGDRWFGVATAYVEGAAASQYRFTSGLPLRVVRLLLPALSPLVTLSEGAAPEAGSGVGGPP